MTDGERAKRRALHLLERMDRTERQLREKLQQDGYSPECVEQAVSYVKSYHYVDDRRYAQNYVRIAQERMSRLQLRRRLLAKGVGRELIDEAMETCVCDESRQILRLLEKRRFSSETADRQEFSRTYQYLMRRGFSSHDILHCMRQV